MGTRADFYIGRGEQAEWLGSIAWDGYPEGIDDAVKTATTGTGFRESVWKFFLDRDDVSLPPDGWPWPWDDSRTTDYAYAFDGGKVWCSRFGHRWFEASGERPDGDCSSRIAVFPNMNAIKNIAWSPEKSGIIIVSKEKP